MGQASEYLGPYGRVAFGFVNEKAHYTIEQRGAWLTAWCMTGLRPGRDGTVKVKPLRAAIGQALFEFLISEGDLVATDDPELLTFRNFEWANEPMERNRRNVQAWRDRQKKVAEAVGGNGADISPSDNGNITGAFRSTLPLMNQRTEDEENGTPTTAREDRDSLDRYYELTQTRPWGRPAGSWLTDLQEQHGVVNVTAALEVEHRSDPSGKNLLGRVAARLARQADRVEKAKVDERRRSGPFAPGTLLAEIRASMPPESEPEPPVDASPEAIAAGRAAFEDLRTKLASGTNGLLGSPAGDRAPSRDDARGNDGSAGTQRPSRSAPSGLRGDAQRSVPPRAGRHEAPTDGAR